MIDFTRQGRHLTKFLVDLTLWLLVTPFAFFIRLDLPWLEHLDEVATLLLIGLPVKAALIFGFGFYHRSWHKVGVRDLFVLIQGVTLWLLVISAVAFFLPPDLAIPRSVPIIESMLALLGLGGVRLLVRLTSERRRRYVNGGVRRAKRVLIAGAGEAGTMIAREMLRHPESLRHPVGFVDDDPSKQRQRFLGLRVLGDIGEIPEVSAEYRIDEVLIAMPSEDGSVVRRVVELARQGDVEHRIIPGIYELLSGKVPISQIREVDVEDLLRREPIQLDVNDIRHYVTGRTVLVTGAGGSIGSEIVRQVARFEPNQVILLGRGENSIYHIAQECRGAWPQLEAHPVIADVRDRQKLLNVFERFRPDVVFHAAAHKHVPLMEAHPDEAVHNNIGGTRNLTELALEFGTERFVNVSTDKAVNPTSVMGASKRVAEYVVEAASRRAAPGQTFVSVRFGNVLGSRGSVIPLFKRQISKRLPVTVTHPDMVRYFMTIPEAAQLVVQAGGLGENGSVYVLDMGEPVKIVDLARDLILLSGLDPDVDIPIIFTGIRPGEKLYEELLTAEEGTQASRHEKIFTARKTGMPEDRLEIYLDELFTASAARDADLIRAVLAEIIPSHRLQVKEVAEA